MGKAYELLKALKARVENDDFSYNKFHKKYSKDYNLVDGLVSFVGSVGSPGLKLDPFLSSTYRSEYAIVSWVIEVLISFPEMIVVLLSEKSVEEKARELLPLLIRFLMAVILLVLSILALKAIGGLPLLITLSVGCLISAIVFLGFKAYALLKAVVAKKAIDTVFEEKVDTLEGILKFLRLWIFDPKALEEKVSDKDHSAEVNHLTSLKKDLKNSLNKELIAKLIKKEALEDGEIAELKKINESIEEIYKLDQQIKKWTKSSDNDKDPTVDTREAMAFENLLSAGVNVLWSGTSIPLIIIGLLILVTPFVPAPPFIGVIVGAIGLSFAVIGGVKSIWEWVYARNEAAVAEKVRTKFLEDLMESVCIEAKEEDKTQTEVIVEAVSKVVEDVKITEQYTPVNNYDGLNANSFLNNLNGSKASPTVKKEVNEDNKLVQDKHINHGF